jgi:hypothetical protein
MVGEPKNKWLRLDGVCSMLNAIKDFGAKRVLRIEVPIDELAAWTERRAALHAAELAEKTAWETLRSAIVRALVAAGVTSKVRVRHHGEPAEDQPQGTPTTYVSEVMWPVINRSDGSFEDLVRLRVRRQGAVEETIELARVLEVLGVRGGGGDVPRH